MADKFNAKDALADYVTVPQRIAQFYELFGGGRLVTSDVQVFLGPDDKPRVMVQAKAYRSEQDTLPGVGWSWMELPGRTSFTLGSELENTETSAWGRAIAALGILVDRSVASQNEVQTKTPDQPVDASLIGKAEAGDTSTSDFETRETSEGYTLGFRLVSDKGKILVRAAGPLAVDLRAHRDAVLIAPVVTVWGRIVDESFTKNGRKITYQVIEATRVRAVGVGDLPSEALPEAMGL